MSTSVTQSEQVYHAQDILFIILLHKVQQLPSQCEVVLSSMSQLRFHLLEKWTEHSVITKKLQLSFISLDGPHLLQTHDYRRGRGFVNSVAVRSWGSDGRLVS